MGRAPSGALAPQGKCFDDELLCLVHSMRKHMLAAAGGCCKIQIVDLGGLLWLAGV
jgi:hypothetical protein